MITKEDIANAYVFLRTKNSTIPDEISDFMKKASLEKLKLEPINKDYHLGFKDGIAYTLKNLENKFKQILKQL